MNVQTSSLRSLLLASAFLPALAVGAAWLLTLPEGSARTRALLLGLGFALLTAAHLLTAGVRRAEGVFFSPSDPFQSRETGGTADGIGGDGRALRSSPEMEFAVRRLARLSASAETIAAGQFDTPVADPSTDGLG